MQIRAATPADVPVIVAMSERFYATTEFPDRLRFPFDPETVERLAASLVDHVLLVADDGAQLRGMVGLFVLPFMFNAAHTSAH